MTEVVTFRFNKIFEVRPRAESEPQMPTILTDGQGTDGVTEPTK